MIELLSIENFRAIHKTPILDLNPRLNVFVGPNGAGKSSLVEGLRFLHESVATDPTRAMARWRGWSSVRHRGATPTDDLSLAFGLNIAEPDISVLYELELEEDANHVDVLVRQEELSIFQSNKEKASMPSLLETHYGKGKVRDDKIKRSTAISLNARDLALRYLADQERFARIVATAEEIRSWRFVNPVPALMRPPTPLSTDASWQETGVAVALQLARATKRELAEVSRRLAGIVDGAVELSASLTGEGALVELKEQVHKGLLPSWTLSDGTLRILAILTALHVGKRPAVLCVEEPENSLHPSVIDNLLSEFSDAADRGTQVIVTTHSPYLLDRISLDAAAAFWVDRKKGGARFSKLPGGKRLAGEMKRFGLGELLAQGALRKSK